MASSVDQDQMLQNAVSDLVLHCLQWPVPILRIITVSNACMREVWESLSGSQTHKNGPETFQKSVPGSLGLQLTI